MGQKVNPIGIRLGISKKQKSNWYASGHKYKNYLLQDINVRNYINSFYKEAAISSICIERSTDKLIVLIYCGRPGVIIGSKGGDIEHLKEKLSKIAGLVVLVNVKEIKKPDADATLVALNIALQLEKRASHKRVMKKLIVSALKAGSNGVKICLSGRLAGAEIARSEWYREGRIPLHTLRANIDYGTAIAKTTYGIIGIKVWIYKGEVRASKNNN